MRKLYSILGAIVGALTGRQFVDEKTCKAREDCVEAKIDGLRSCVEAKMRSIEDKIDRLYWLIDKFIRGK